MSWTDFASEIQAAAVSVLSTDAAVKVGGTLGVVTIESEPPQPGGAMPDLAAAQMPYVGVRCESSKATPIGTRTLALEHELVLRVVVEQNTASEAYKSASAIADAAARVVRDQCASPSWLASGAQCLIDGWSKDGPVAEADNPCAYECVVRVPCVVVYPEA